METRQLRTIGFVPARGGSKGLARDNLLEVEGTSFVRHAAEVAHQTAIEDRLNGAVYARRAEALRRAETRVTADPVAVVMTNERSVDVDGEADLLPAGLLADRRDASTPDQEADR